MSRFYSSSPKTKIASFCDCVRYWNLWNLKPTLVGGLPKLAQNYNPSVNLSYCLWNLTIIYSHSLDFFESKV
ncbi:hypothetical protein [Helicobacter typhlonius]|uniref:Uncharacterized protein n=1 Tax=Helicobacter typhlonius TaxID=76936 RepID=A0A0S4PTN5_9HELI|nr:hypothetical protein [Helicobacter typhlonius]TLD79483.1 hypothetical protein LS75_000655 [Helicobacter typhlonius]CUU39404.1 Hypothetical protein BN2458_PEG0518 [Helicobacter typhlonius]